MIPRFSAMVTAWARSLAPSFDRMLVMRLLMVASATISRSAICLLKFPAATSQTLVLVITTSPTLFSYSTAMLAGISHPISCLLMLGSTRSDFEPQKRGPLQVTLPQWPVLFPFAEVAAPGRPRWQR
jgi:hypothetical protein